MLLCDPLVCITWRCRNSDPRKSENKVTLGAEAKHSHASPPVWKGWRGPVLPQLAGKVPLVWGFYFYLLSTEVLGVRTLECWSHIPAILEVSTLSGHSRAGTDPLEGPSSSEF